MFIAAAEASSHTLPTCTRRLGSSIERSELRLSHQVGEKLLQTVEEITLPELCPQRAADYGKHGPDTISLAMSWRIRYGGCRHES